MLLNDFLGSDRNININVDNDGVWSGVILNRFFGCEICGFNNNGDTILHQYGIPYDHLVYVDLHVGYPHIKSVDQHMVSVDTQHNQFLAENNNKLNPNINYGIVWEDYTNKFPYSTTIYLLALCEGSGKDLSWIDLSIPVGDGFRLGDVLWQTDSSYENYFKYNRNATNWLPRLREISNNGEFTNRLIHWLENEIPKDKQERSILSSKIGLWYREKFKCWDDHGSIKTDYLTSENKIKDNILYYLMTVGNIIGSDMSGLKDKIFETTLMRCRSFTYSTVKDRFDSTKLFSYGFIWGLSKDRNIRASYEPKSK